MNRSLYDSNINKHLIIANVLFFILFCGDMSPLNSFGPMLSLWYFDSPNFQVWQLITHFFMHGNLPHIFLNMYALYLFGSILEKVWGPKKYLFFYFTTGILASILYMFVTGIEYYMTPGIGTFFPYSDGILGANEFIPMVGASGAIFGILTAFAMLFPNTELSLLFPPITLKAKYFVLIYIGIELYLGFQQSAGDNVAHFAHLTGALVGFILVKIWQKSRTSFY